MGMTPTQEMLDSLIAAWRQHRHPRLADLVDVLEEEVPWTEPAIEAARSRSSANAWASVEAKRNPRDFPRLASAIRAGFFADVVAHVGALSAWDDPRLVVALIALLEDPLATGTKAQPLVAAILVALEATRDPRVSPLVEAAASRYTEIDDSAAGRRTAAALESFAARMKALPVEALPDELAVECAALERAFPDSVARKRAARRSTTDRLALEGLLTTVYAAPDDDGPRLVYADALLERGDPRGELIVLQIADARGDGTPADAERERALLSDANRRAWSEPFSSLGYCRFVRGFPEEVSIHRPISRGLAKHPAWSLITTLSTPPAQLATLLARPNFRRVRRLVHLRLDHLEECAAAGVELVGIRELTLSARRTPDENLLRIVPNLEKLELAIDASAESGTVALGPILSSATKLVALRLDRVDVDELPHAFDPLHHLRELRLSSCRGTLTRAHLAALSSLNDLDADNLRIERGALAALTQLVSLTFLGDGGDDFTLDDIPDAPLRKLFTRAPSDPAELARVLARLPLLDELTLIGAFERPYGRPSQATPLVAIAEKSSARSIRFNDETLLRSDGGFRLEVRENGELARAILAGLAGLTAPVTIDLSSVSDAAKRAELEAGLRAR